MSVFLLKFLVAIIIFCIIVNSIFSKKETTKVKERLNLFNLIAKIAIILIVIALAFSIFIEVKI